MTVVKDGGMKKFLHPAIRRTPSKGAMRKGIAARCRDPFAISFIDTTLIAGSALKRSPAIRIFPSGVTLPLGAMKCQCVTRRFIAEEWLLPQESFGLPAIEWSCLCQYRSVSN